MRKSILILMLILLSCGLFASAYNFHTEEQQRENFEKLIEGKFSFRDSLMSFKVDFDKDYYDVGDEINVTVHIKLNPKYNPRNMKFVVLNSLKYRLLEKYGFLHSGKKTDNIDITDLREQYIEELESGNLKYDDFYYVNNSDDECILSNNNPEANFKVCFTITRKIDECIFANRKYSIGTFPIYIRGFDYVPKDVYNPSAYKNRMIYVRPKLYPSALNEVDINETPDERTRRIFREKRKFNNRLKEESKIELEGIDERNVGTILADGSLTYEHPTIGTVNIILRSCTR